MLNTSIIIKNSCTAILRENSCLEILLHQLKSPSLTIVSNACGTLWNLSARCKQDQVFFLHLFDHVFCNKTFSFRIKNLQLIFHLE